MVFQNAKTLIVAQYNTIVLIVYFYKDNVKFFIDFSLKNILTLRDGSDNIKTI